MKRKPQNRRRVVPTLIVIALMLSGAANIYQASVHRRDVIAYRVLEVKAVAIIIDLTDRLEACQKAASHHSKSLANGL